MILDDVSVVDLVGAAAPIIAAIITCILSRKNKAEDNGSSKLILPEGDDIDVHIKRRKQSHLKRFIMKFIKYSIIYIIVAIAAGLIFGLEEDIIYIIIALAFMLALICAAKLK